MYLHVLGDFLRFYGLFWWFQRIIKDIKRLIKWFLWLLRRLYVSLRRF